MVGENRCMSGYPSSAPSRVFLVCLLLLAAACGDDPASARTVELSGVVTDVDARGLTDVTSFKLRAEGTSHRVFVTDRTRFAFAPSHLTEHLATARPVRVDAQRRDGRLVAVAVDDA
jgi:hypothetical protein